MVRSVLQGRGGGRPEGLGSADGLEESERAEGPQVQQRQSGGLTRSQGVRGRLGGHAGGRGSEFRVAEAGCRWLCSEGGQPCLFGGCSEEEIKVFLGGTEVLCDPGVGSRTTQFSHVPRDGSRSLGMAAEREKGGRIVSRS